MDNLELLKTRASVEGKEREISAIEHEMRRQGLDRYTRCGCGR